MSEKNKTCTLVTRMRNHRSILAHLARSYLCARAYGAEKRIQTIK